MAKSKKVKRAYAEGLKDGAAPYEVQSKKMEESCRETSSKMDEIARNQRKQGKDIGKIADGAQKNEQDINTIKENLQREKGSADRLKIKLKNVKPLLSSVSSSCDVCGSTMGMYQLVCSSCGTISKVFPYELAAFDIEDKCRAEVSDLAEIIKESKEKDDDWLYEELNDKFVKMKKIKNIAYQAMKNKEEKHASEYRKIYDYTRKFFFDYRKKRIEIAVVGTVKAGKSSLINALIGTKLASVDATPETSILVKYHTTDKGNYLRIKFYTEHEWNKLWETTKDAVVFREDYERLNADSKKYDYLGKKEMRISCTAEELPELMMKWSKSDTPEHFFVKEIEVGYESESIPHDVFLVDTPGLSDPVKYRSKITRNYIKNSDWILACIACENLSGQPEFNFLSKVISNKGGDVSKIFVVATKKDMLTQTEEQKKTSEFKKRLGLLYNNPEMAVSRFASVSSECDLLTRKVIKGEKLEDEDRDKLEVSLLRIRLRYPDVNSKSEEILKYAGVTDLFSHIEDVVLKNRRKIIIDQIKDDYYTCMWLINQCSSEFLDDAKKYLGEITDRREIDQNEIDELEKANAEIDDLREKIREVRRQLEIRISINDNN